MTPTARSASLTLTPAGACEGTGAFWLAARARSRGKAKTSQGADVAAKANARGFEVASQGALRDRGGLGRPCSMRARFTHESAHAACRRKVPQRIRAQKQHERPA